MKKHTAKIITMLLTVVFAVCLAMGLAGCSSCSGGDDNQTTGTKYDAIYEAYAEVLGEDALDRDEWYNVYFDSIEGAALGNFEVEKTTLVTDNGKNYVEFVINGNIYLLDLSGSNFTHSVTFVITATKHNGDTVSGVNLDIYDASSKTTWRTVQTGADGIVKFYVPAADTKTYGVKVSATGDSNLTYGIIEGEEVTFSAQSQSKSLNVVLADIVTYIIQVKDALGRGVQGVALGVYHIGGSSDVEIANGVTGTAGNLTLFLALKEGETYVVRIRDVENALPEGYYPEEEEYVLSQVTRINLYKTAKYYDTTIEAQETIVAQETGYPTYEPVPVEASEDLEIFMRKNSSGYYILESLGEYSGLYVALDYPLAQVMGKNVTIYDLLKESGNEYLFIKKVPHTEDGLTEDEAKLDNVWNRYIYTDMLLEYCENVNPDGLYPLNDDLLDFLKACSYLFEGYTGADTDWQLAVVHYDGPVLGLGADAAFSEVKVPKSGFITINLRSTLPTGAYRLKLITATANLENNIWVEVENDFCTLPLSTLKTGDAGKYYEVIVYLREGESTYITINNNSAVDQKFTAVQLDKYNGEEDTVVNLPVEEITESGVYEFVLLPDGMFSYTFSAKLLKRTYYEYKIELAEALPAGVSSVTMYSVFCTGDISGNPFVGQNDTMYLKNSTMSAPGTAYSGTVSSVNATRLTSPGIFFIYSGTEILKIKVKVTIKLTRINVNYDSGEGGGSIDAATEQKPGDFFTLSTGDGMYKDDHVLVGWLDAVSGEIYAPGATIILPSYDLTLVAQWKVEKINEVAQALDTEHSVATAYSTEYTAIRISFGEVEEGGYLLIASFGEYRGDFITVQIGSRVVTLVYSAQRSNSDKYVYTMYLDISAEDETILFFVTEKNINTTMTVSLEAGLTAVLETNMTSLVMMGPGDTTEAGIYKITFGNSVQPGETYKLTYSTPVGATARTFKAVFSDGIVSSKSTFGSNVSSTSSSLATEITMPEDLTGAYLYIYARTATVKEYTMANLTLSILYSLTYEAGEGSGAPAAVTKKIIGDEVTVSKTVPEREDYRFMGWSLNGESVYDAAHASDYVHGGDIIVIDGDVVLTAVWKRLDVNTKELGKDNEINVEIDSEKYDGGTYLNLTSEVADGKYVLYANFGKDMGKTVAFTLGYDETYNFVYDSNLGKDGEYVYVAYLYVSGEDRFVYFNFTTVGTITASIKLEEYKTLSVKTAEEGYVPFTPYSVEEGKGFAVTLDSDMAGKVFYIKLTHFTGFDNPSLYIRFYGEEGYISQTTTTSTIFTGTNGAKITIPAGATMFYIVPTASAGDNFGYFRILVTATLTVTYNVGEGEVGTAPAPHQNIEPNTKVSLRANTLLKQGYIFAGWTDGVNTYQPSEQVTVSANMVLTAVWTVDEGSVSDKLAANASVSGNVKRSGKQLINFADGITAGLYTVTFEAKSTLGERFTATVGGATADFILNKALSSEGKFVYVSYMYLTAETGYFIFDVTVESEVQVKISLDTYTTAEVLANGETYIVPVNAYGTENPFKFLVKNADGTEFTGSYVYVTINTYSSVTMLLWFNGSESLAVSGTVEKDLLSGNIWYLIGSTEANTEWKTVTISIIRSYTVSYSGGEGAEGFVEPHNTVKATTEVILKENEFARNGYVFIGWTVDGEKVYQPGDKFAIGHADVVISAVWGKNDTFNVEGELNKEKSVEFTTDYTEHLYYAVTLGDAITEGMYVVTAESAEDLGKYFLATLGEYGVIFTYSSVQSTETKYVYVGYIYYSTESGPLTIQALGGKSHTLTVKIADYVAPTVSGDTSIVEAPFNPYYDGEDYTKYLSIGIAENRRGTSMGYEVIDYSGYLVSHGYGVQLSYPASGTGVKLDPLTAGASVKFGGNSEYDSMFLSSTAEGALKFFIMVGVKTSCQYTITYKVNNATYKTVTCISGDTVIAEGYDTVISQTSSGISYFMAWSSNVTIGSSKMVYAYQPFTMPDEDVTFTASAETLTSSRFKTAYALVSVGSPVQFQLTPNALSNFSFASHAAGLYTITFSGVASVMSGLVKLNFATTSKATMATCDIKSNIVYLYKTSSTSASATVYLPQTTGNTCIFVYPFSSVTTASNVTLTITSATTSSTLKADGTSSTVALQNLKTSDTAKMYSSTCDSSFEVGSKYKLTFALSSGVWMGVKLYIPAGTKVYFSGTWYDVEPDGTATVTYTGDDNKVCLYTNSSSPASAYSSMVSLTATPVN